MDNIQNCEFYEYTISTKVWKQLFCPGGVLCGPEMFCASECPAKYATPFRFISLLN
jgi:hypothetical protein